MIIMQRHGSMLIEHETHAHAHTHKEYTATQMIGLQFFRNSHSNQTHEIQKNTERYFNTRMNDYYIFEKLQLHPLLPC